MQHPIRTSVRHGEAAAEGGSAGGPVETAGGYVVYRVKEKAAASQADFQKEKAQITSRLWEQNSDRFFRSWLEEQKKKAGIRLKEEGAGI